MPTQADLVGGQDRDAWEPYLEGGGFLQTLALSLAALSTQGGEAASAGSHAQHYARAQHLAFAQNPLFKGVNGSSLPVLPTGTATTAYLSPVPVGYTRPNYFPDEEVFTADANWETFLDNGTITVDNTKVLFDGVRDALTALRDATRVAHEVDDEFRSDNGIKKNDSKKHTKILEEAERLLKSLDKKQEESDKKKVFDQKRPFLASSIELYKTLREQVEKYKKSLDTAKLEDVSPGASAGSALPAAAAVAAAAVAVTSAAQNASSSSSSSSSGYPAEDLASEDDGFRSVVSSDDEEGGEQRDEDGEEGDEKRGERREEGGERRDESSERRDDGELGIEERKTYALENYTAIVADVRDVFNASRDVLEATEQVRRNLQKVVETASRGKTQWTEEERAELMMVASALQNPLADETMWDANGESIAAAETAERDTKESLTALEDALSAIMQTHQLHTALRKDYSLALNDARLETVAKYIDEDDAFRIMFAPQTLAALADASDQYREALEAYESAWMRLRETMNDTGIRDKAMKRIIKSIESEVFSADSGFALTNRYRVAFATLRTSDRHPPVQDVEICDTKVPGRCYEAHLPPPPMPSAYSGTPEQVFSHLVRMFGSLPPVTVHFENNDKQVSNPDHKINLLECLRDGKHEGVYTKEDFRAALFQLTYSMAGIFAVNRYRLNFPTNLRDLAEFELAPIKTRESSLLYTVMGPGTREDYELPATTLHVTITPRYDELTTKNTLEASAEDLKKLLFLMLTDATKPDKAVRDVRNTVFEVVHQMATELFGKSYEAEFFAGQRTVPNAREDATIFDALDCSVFNKYRLNRPSGRTPTCVWERPD